MSSEQRERALITKVIETGDLLQVIKGRVEPTYIADPDNREVFRYLLKTYQKFGKTPSAQALLDEFPQFGLVDADDDLSILIDGVKRRKLYEDIQSALGDISAETRADPRDGLETLKRLSMELSARHSETRGLEVTQSVDGLREQLRLIKESGGVLGTPWPWQKMTKITKGVRDGQYIGFYGPTGTFKTFLLIFIANWLHEEYGHIPTFFTKEMPAEDILFRLAAIRAKVDFDKLQDGLLDDESERRMAKTLDELEEAPPFYIHEIQSQGMAAVAEIKAITQEQKSTITFLDGVYFLAEGAEWQNFATVNTGIRDMTVSTKVSCISSNQANSERAKGRETNDVGYGKSWVQALDVAVRVSYDPIHQDRGQMQLRVKKVRNGRPGAFMIGALPCYDFAEKGWVDGSDAENGVDAGGGVLEEDD
jgi:replicative DNA helicase